jgi:hypothetical protein
VQATGGLAPGHLAAAVVARGDRDLGMPGELLHHSDIGAGVEQPRDEVRRRS